ncbi:MAG: RNA polymerase sigma factor [Chloroflexi bacterium]|nr:RNA polymerase sigma factor [Chloroflexota bacterium]
MTQALVKLDEARVDPVAAHVRRARAGDERSFERLLDDRIASLLRLALAIVGDEHDARDAVQQACVQAWRELPRLREPDRFDAWLGRILTNQCRTMLRSRRRRRVREVAVSDLDVVAGGGLGGRSVAGPGDESADLDTLSRAFDRLDPDARVLLALHHLEGRSVAEIAARMDAPQSTIKWRLHTARGALERALEVERR